jgi:hypothetical protein
MVLVALLLIAGTPTPSPPQHPEAGHTKAATEQHYEHSTPISTVSDHAGPQTAPKPGNSYTYNHYYPAAPSESPPIPFQEVTTVVLIVFTGGLWVTSILQWSAIKAQSDAAKKSTDIASKTLLLQFRPKLIVRDVAIDQVEETFRDGKQWVPVLKGHPVVGRFYIANAGDSTATIKEILSMVFWQSDPLPMRRPYEDQSGVCPLARKLIPGQSICWPFDSVRPLDVDRGLVLRWQNIGHPPRVNLYIMGWIEYSDALGFVRRTTFCRQLNPQTLRFFKIEDSDYEHEE